MRTVKCQTWSDESNLTQQDLDPFKDRRMRGGGTFLTRGREGGAVKDPDAGYGFTMNLSSLF